VANGDVDARFSGQLESSSRQRREAVAVGTACIGGDEEPFGIGVGEAADFGHQAPDRLHGELGGVMAVADRDEALVLGEVVDAIRHRLWDLGVGEVVDVDSYRLALRLPFLALVGEVADDLLLLVSTEMTGCPSLRCALARASMWRNLGVAIGVLGALVLLAGACRL